MKKITTLVSACFLLVLSYSTQAQADKCCAGSVVAPEVQGGVYATPIMLDSSYTPAPILDVPATDLPNIEYIITKRNQKSLDALGVQDTTGGGGDVILGADADGIFRPIVTRYGLHLSPGDTFDITAVGYNLALLKTLGDSLLNGYSGATPCCSLFVAVAGVAGKPELEGFCDSVRNAGILNATHLNNMNDVLTIFDQFSAGQTSIPSVISTLKLINSYGSLISVDCGGTGQNNFMPYGVNRYQKYGYTREGTIAVTQLSDVSLFLIFPNPATDDVQINFTTSQQVDLNINVYDAVGQRVYAQTLGSVSGNISTQIPLSNFASGMYYVELTDGHSSQTHKLMVK